MSSVQGATGKSSSPNSGPLHEGMSNVKLCRTRRMFGPVSLWDVQLAGLRSLHGSPTGPSRQAQTDCWDRGSPRRWKGRQCGSCHRKHRKPSVLRANNMQYDVREYTTAQHNVRQAMVFTATSSVLEVLYAHTHTLASSHQDCCSWLGLLAALFELYVQQTCSHILSILLELLVARSILRKPSLCPAKPATLFQTTLDWGPDLRRSAMALPRALSLSLSPSLSLNRSSMVPDRDPSLLFEPKWPHKNGRKSREGSLNCASSRNSSKAASNFCKRLHTWSPAALRFWPEPDPGTQEIDPEAHPPSS